MSIGTRWKGIVKGFSEFLYVWAQQKRQQGDQ